MKKIMFNDRYGLTEAVLEKRKTMTRRMMPIGLYNQTDWKAVSEGDYEAVVDGEGDYHDIRRCGQYQIGEEVAVAQSYKTLIEQGYLCRESDGWVNEKYIVSAGYQNKMFVRADLMPQRIRITNIRVERLQDITDEDCMREGIMAGEQEPRMFGFRLPKGTTLSFLTPRAAFSVAAIFLFFWWLMPRCPKCDRIVHPMDVYCSGCGQQLRTTNYE